MINERELVNCPITGQVKIGKNLDIYGSGGGAAGSRSSMIQTFSKQRLGETAFTFCSASNGQDRVKTFLTSKGMFHPSNHNNNEIPLLK